MQNFGGKITGFLAPQTRHGMGAQWSCSPRETWSRKCAKVRIVSRSYAKVHESSHRSGPWLRDVTHCYGWEAFFNKEGRKGGKQERKKTLNRRDGRKGSQAELGTNMGRKETRVARINTNHKETRRVQRGR